MKEKISILAFSLLLTASVCLSPLRAEKVPSPLGEVSAEEEGQTSFYTRRNLRDLVSGRVSTAASLRILFIRVAFSDRGFDPGYGDPYMENELRHLEEYYQGASLGAFSLDWELAPETVILPFEESYYGDNEPWDARVPEILMTAVDSLDDAYDFSAWDGFAIIHAGPGAETDFNGDSPEQLWSGFIDPDEMRELLADTLGTPGVPTGDGTLPDTFFIDNLMVLPEYSSQDGFTFGSLGIYAYQVAKRLGMVALYDPTPSGRPDSQGIGSFGLMAYGLYNALGFVPSFPCAFQRYLLGWVEPVVVTSDSRIDIKDINQYSTGDTAMVKIEAGPGEYFLVVNRLHDHDLDRRFDFGDLNGNGIPENEDDLLGAEFDFYITGTTDPSESIEGVKYTDTGSGIKIWHIDERIISDRVSAGRNIVSDPTASGVDLEEADGIQDLDRVGGTYAFGSHLDSYRSGVNSAFGESTNPSSALNSGIASNVNITGISGTALRMSFDVSFGTQTSGTVATVRGDISDLSPVAIPTAGGTDLLLAVNDGDTARIYRISRAGASAWDGETTEIVTVGGVSWAGPPVPADFDGSGGGSVFDEFMISSRGVIYAFGLDGAPLVIDDDSTPGSLEVRGTGITSGLALPSESIANANDILFLSGDGDSIFAYLVGPDVSPGSERYAGPGVSTWTVCGGELVSHTSLASMTGIRHGFYFAYADGGVINLAYSVPVPDAMIYDEEIPGAFESMVSLVQEGDPNTVDSLYLSFPSSGDIDRDGFDEMVIGLPGTGLVYFDLFGPSSGAMPPFLRGEGISVAGGIGRSPSPPALADLDGDGVLETIVRDQERLWVTTSFGAIASGWPRRRGGSFSGLESTLVPPQPLAADIDGDGRLDAVFNIAGDIYFEEYESLHSTLPVARGERGDGISHAVVDGESGGLYIFTAGNVPAIEGAGLNGLDISSGVTSIRRYALPGDAGRGDSSHGCR